MKKKLLILVMVLSLSALPVLSYSHSGRTDSSGGHHDYENQSGLGSYHYHHGYGPHLHDGGVCPYGGGSGYDSAARGSSNLPIQRNLEITQKPQAPIKVGEKTQLKTDRDYPTWTSSDEKIATVSSSGEVEAVGVGKVIITATSNDGASDSFTLVVDPIKTEEVMLTWCPSKITIGKTSTLKAEVSPKDATDKNLTWKVSDESLAKITTDGEITGIGIGFLEVIVEQGNITDSQIIQIVPEIESVEIQPNVNKIELNKGDSITLTAVVSPTNALLGDVNWESDNPDVATVSKNGRVKAKSSGTASIIVKAENYKSDVIIIEVTSNLMAIVYMFIFLIACVAVCIIGFKARSRDNIQL